MLAVTINEYDGGSASGDGNLTRQTLPVDSNSTNNRVTASRYDWRNRQTQITAAQDWYQVNTYDTLNRVTQVQRYSQATNNLIWQDQTLYDDRGRVYQTIQYAVDPSTGAVGNSLVDNIWYDAGDNVIKQLPAGSSAFTKNVYDGAKRLTAKYVGYDLGASESTYAGASDVTDDMIVEQTEAAYDDASNVIQSTFRQRFHNANGTGPLTYPGGPQPQARVTYAAFYPDALGRPQAQCNYGTNGDAAFTRSSTIPASSNGVLVASTNYNSRGEAYQEIDPAGRLDQTTFDDAGRRTELVLNVQGSCSSYSSSSNSLPTSDDRNNTTLWSYTPDSLVATLTAVNAATGDQVTTYGYGTSLPTSDVARNDVLSSTTHPDGGVVNYLLNRQSQVKQFTDQRQVVHQYEFDLLGRQVEDLVASLRDGSSISSGSSSTSGAPSGVDGTVRRIAQTYGVRGLPQSVTSYSSPIIGQGFVVNDVQRVYNDFAQLITEYQEHNGAVDTSTSANVQYQYADGSSNTVRPTALVYPNGRLLNYSYGASRGMDDALSRIASLIDDDGVTHLVDYTRIGEDMFVGQSSPQPQIAWSLINGAGVDPYTGLDQFNRVVDSRWYSTATNSDLDRIQHGYDAASNRLWRRNTVAGAAGAYLDELYSYDGLYRLTETQRGSLNASNDGVVSGTLGFAQAWGLDAAGNWGQFWENSSGSSWNLQQIRSVSEANEITAITGGGWAQPSYDAAGNIAQYPQPANPATADNATFDAWSRLVAVASGGSPIQQNTYDGAFRRISTISSSGTRHLYYTAQWQDIEERVGSSTTPDRQFIWGVRHLDDLLLRDSSEYSPSRLYGLQDTNLNVDAVFDPTGAAVERYSYTSYGEPAFLSPVFASQGSSAVGWETLYSGYRRDNDCGLYHVRSRVFDSQLGAWTSRDPAESDVNLYRYVSNRPTILIDSLGLVAGSSGTCTRQDIRRAFSVPDIVHTVMQALQVPDVDVEGKFYAQIKKCKKCCATGITKPTVNAQIGALLQAKGVSWVKDLKYVHLEGGVYFRAGFAAALAVSYDGCTNSVTGGGCATASLEAGIIGQAESTVGGWINVGAGIRGGVKVRSTFCLTCGAGAMQYYRPNVYCRAHPCVGLSEMEYLVE